MMFRGTKIRTARKYTVVKVRVWPARRWQKSVKIAEKSRKMAAIRSENLAVHLRVNHRVFAYEALYFTTHYSKNVVKYDATSANTLWNIDAKCTKFVRPDRLNFPIEALVAR
ncbi:hypothetical protein B9Z55_012948 [Caenorhabditis nigoni]|uniref:Uncharacterized protein n=1 Tax=Caenorhabditis nigoni TaxID=1611254 RepID=A0A2G5TZL7_9PELO|nr:hypothetical protein B9Z55_012948 [Caenorhabditis nigoni]